MIKIHNLNRAGKLAVSDVPDPDRTVGNDDLFFGLGPASPPSFGVDAAAEFFGRRIYAGIGSGTFIAHPPARCIGTGLGKHATELHFSRMCRFAVFALSAFGLFRG